MKKNFIYFVLIYGLYCMPPKQIPENLYNEFTMGGKIAVSHYYIDGTLSRDNPIIFTKEAVNEFFAQVKQRKTFYYGITDTWLYQALEKYPIKNQKIAVFGSVKPVYESICLFYGGIPITIEYNKWITDHPSLQCITPDEYDKNPILFDAGLSISSFEHDGLGRYGDPINPWADLKTMQKVKKMIKPNGILFLAVPVGIDRLEWNAHRIYGKIRLPLLLRGWQIVDCFGMQGLNDTILDPKLNVGRVIQPVLVLRNILMQN